MTNLFQTALRCLETRDPRTKVHETREAVACWRNGSLRIGEFDEPACMPVPGRPERPRLVGFRELPRRKPGSPMGRAALIHAVTHIEFNAINLAWDAVYRFRGLPAEFYGDWIRVAGEEASHFGMLRQYLNDMGYDYGDFDAHNGLWEMAVKTAHDPLLRMALVPRVLEARGLDVTPGMMERLHSQGEPRGVEILSLILREEEGHVAIGTRWFRYFCRERGLPPADTFADLLGRYMPGPVKGPLNEAARRRAGFDAEEMSMLERLAGLERE